MTTLKKQKLVVTSFALAFVLLTFIGIGAYRQWAHNLRSTEWVQHTYEVLSHLSETLSLIQDIETGARGYVITGQDSYLQSHQNSLEKIGPKIQSLRQLTADDPAQQHNLGTLEPLITQKIALMKRNVALRRTAGQKAAEQAVASGEGKRVMDEIRRVIAQMEAAENQLLQDRTDGLRASNVRTLGTFAMLTLFLGVLLVGGLRLLQRDIAAKQREVELTAKARAYAENIVDTVREPLLVLDQDLKVRSANRSFYQTFGVTPQETEGALLYDLGAGQWNLPELKNLLGTILPMNSRLEDFQVDQDFPGLGRRTMLLNARKMYRMGNRTETILLAFEDITLKKEAEQALLRAKEEAQRTSKFKDQFLSTMSHELRTPLNAILGFSELLQDERYGQLEERQRRYLTHIHTGGQHLLRLISDILDLSKIEAGRLELAIEDVAVNPAVGEVLSSMRPLAEKKSLALSFQGDEALAVKADSTRFKQILMNLLGNAIKFTPEGGQIEVFAKPQNGDVRVEIRDTGPGIPPEEQKRIFDAFVRLQQTGNAEGTGLGLAITQRLVEMHGGQLGLESQVGQGSCFYFTLPGSVGVRRSRVAGGQAKGRAKETRSVLVIEDDLVAGQLIFSQLTSAGYEPVLCDQPAAALGLAADLQPQAITLDILMKPINGFEILLQLKNDPRTRAIPVIVLTVVDQAAMGITIGADEYLVKPVEKEILLGAIERCLADRGGHGARAVLVVEDDPTTREIIGDLLTGAGYAVTLVPDGSEAQAAVADSLPGVVILGLLLPKVSGFELIAHWRADQRTADLPVLVLTGKDLSAVEENYIRTHTKSLLRKQQPWQEELLRQLKSVTATGTAWRR